MTGRWNGSPTGSVMQFLALSKGRRRSRGPSITSRITSGSCRRSERCPPRLARVRVQPPGETVNATGREAAQEDRAPRGRALEDRHHARQVPDQEQGWSAHRRADGLRELHTGRLTSQANILHTFASPRLAALYAKRRGADRARSLRGHHGQGRPWSAPVKLGKASIRVFFSPEPSGKRVSLDTVVAAVKAAKQSAVFCMFSPTDKPSSTLFSPSATRSFPVHWSLCNAISDPSKKKPGAETGSEEPPKQPKSGRSGAGHHFQSLAEG